MQSTPMSHHSHNHPFRSGSLDRLLDLPSDAEDTFFLTPDETADLHRIKRLRHLDHLRNAQPRSLSTRTLTMPLTRTYGAAATKR
jgi:hypothetical protein